MRAVQDLERGVRRVPRPGTGRRLADALGLGAEDRALVLAASARPEANEANAPRTSVLPVKLTTFVGRDHEIAELRQRLDTTRLLTLVGPGGIGKTRLALEIAASVAGRYREGVFFVDIAPLTRPELVVQALAQAIGVRTELDRQPQTAILTFLAARELLAIVDNCEHLISACAELIETVLRQCPNVRVLATSREPLGVEGEALWRLGPLAERDAICLFLDRARAQSNDVDVDDPAVRHVCRALDHLPLAIELAAARTSLLRPGEILPRLENRFALLKRADGPTGLPRQRTLRATVDWSYELLEPAEQQLFRRLAVFAGPFDLAAAFALGGPDALDVMAHLVAKSLVVATVVHRGTRYRLLDTLRRYAWERLYAAGGVELARQLHLSHFLGRAASLFTPTDSVDGRTRELDEYLDDLRSAFEWCLKADDPTAGLRLIAATRDVWWRQSLAEGRRWAKLFLERCPEPSLARAQALQAAGLLEGLGDPQRARQLLLEARELAAPLDRATTAMVDYCLGFAAFIEEDATAAVEHLERSVNTIQALGDVNGAAIVSVMLGWVLLTDNSRRAEAKSRLERAHQVAVELGDRYSAAAAEYGLGLYWRWTGQPRRALASFRHALEPLRGLEGTPILSGTLLHIARLLAESEPARASRLAGAGLAVAERMGVHFAPRLLGSIEQLRADLEQRLGREYARQAWADGERLTAGEAIASALHDGHSESMRPGGLTARELELTQLVARGLTSPQIAGLLHVSPRTVDNHLARIYSKLGLASRLQLATWFGHAAATQTIANHDASLME